MTSDDAYWYDVAMRHMSQGMDEDAKSAPALGWPLLALLGHEVAFAVFAWRAAGWIGLVVAVVLGGVALMACRALKGETTRLAIGAGQRL